MAYGTPHHPSEIEAYYTDIRRGRPPTPEALADLTARYAAIGGVSPLAALTAAQRDAIQAALDERRTGHVRRRARDEAHRSAGRSGGAHGGRGRRRSGGRAGARAALLVVLDRRLPRAVPSGHRGGRHRNRTTRHRAGSEVELRGIESWATEPALVAFLADDLGPRVAAMRAATGRGSGCSSQHIRSRSASSTPAIPTPTSSGPPPRPWPIGSTCANWSIAWQSAGRTPEPWIGPDILQVIDELGAVGRVRRRDRVCLRVRGRSPRGAVRPRHRGRAPCGASRARLRPHRQRQRRPDVMAALADG